MSRDETRAKPGLRILHTSDWHLGKALYGQSRENESRKFLDWLYEQLRDERVAVMLVAGDVFDNPNPPHWAQQLYYSFLWRVREGWLNGELACRHVVVTAGNHDSGTLLDAPADLLRPMAVTVRGVPGATAADDLLTLCAPDGMPELLVAAAPYLRESDLGAPTAGQTLTEREEQLAAAIAARYQALAEAAAAKNATLARPVPVVAMGHLFTADLRVDADDESERALYVGSLGRVAVDALSPDRFAYFALGHVHRPLRAGGRDRVRYCGSPLPMDFGEAGQQKEVVIFDADDGNVREVPVPNWQRLENLQGDWPTLAEALARLRERHAALPEGEEVWLSIACEGEAPPGNLADLVDAAVAGSNLKVTRLRNLCHGQRVADARDAEAGLRQFTPRDIFERLLEERGFNDAEKAECLQTFTEAVTALEREDSEEGENHANP